MKLGSSLRRRRGKREKGLFLGGLIPKREKSESGGEGRRWTFLKEPRTLGLLAGLAVVGFGGGYLVSTQVLYPLPPPPGDLFPVPDLFGQTVEQASDTLEAIGLILGSADSMNHPEVPAGRILGQSPLPDQLSLPGQSVRIAISTGRERRPVPDVLGLQAHRARTILETSGFTVQEDSTDSDAPRGQVIQTGPEPGTLAEVPMEVRIRVSMGPEEFEMPLLLGLSEDDARAVLDSVGLVLDSVETRFRFGRDQGLVVEQVPPARTMVQEGGAVRLVVGRRGQ
jgi:beta-lactam-binding protein with PASTA domain